MKSKIPSFYLLIVASLWGLTFPLIEMSMESVDPCLYVSIRFTLAALPILPYFIKNLNREFLIIGIVLGLIHCGAFIFQTVGLQTVNASRGAFLTGTYVLLIPFISPFFKMDFPTRHDFASAFICLIGIFILTGCDIGEFSLGDAWVLASAFFIALSIVYIGLHSKNNINPYMLAYSQIVMTAIFSWIPTLYFSDLNFGSLLTMTNITSLLINSLLATLLAIYLQSKYQKYVSLQNTALIFSFEPVFASIFDSILTTSKPTSYTILGGAVILVSILYLELYKDNPRNCEVNHA